MSKGYVYIMTTAVEGIIKIGRSDNWTRRCQDQLEANGYKNMNGLKTYFVVQVGDQEEIESIMHDIFRESRVSNFEMFAVDKDRAKRVLSKMGTQVFPEIEIKQPKKIDESKVSIQDYYKLFWKDFNAVLVFNDTPLKPRNEDQNFRMYFNYGTNYSINLIPKENVIKFKFFTDEISYNKMIANKEIIEKELGRPIYFKAEIGSVSKKMQYECDTLIENFDITNYDKQVVTETLNVALKFRDVITNYLKGI